MSNYRAVTITDVVLQNPHGDAGMMRILARPQTIRRRPLDLPSGNAVCGLIVRARYTLS